MRKADKRKKIRFTGAVYTPADIAIALIKQVIPLVPTRPLEVLEPSVGDGVFLHEMIKLQQEHKFTAVDIDSQSIKTLVEGLAGCRSSLNLVCGDFIEYAISKCHVDFQKFDLIIGNPPFIRGRHFSEEFKSRLAAFSAVASYPLIDLKNSWVAFLIASGLLVSPDGVVALILPYELMTVDYGRKALQTLSAAYERIDLFISKSKAFPSIDQDAVIFVGQKKTNRSKGLYINHVESMIDLSSPVIHKLSALDKSNSGIELSSFLLPQTTVKLLVKLRARAKKISDFAGSAPGIVSAANEFFILTKARVEELKVEDYVIPILKKGSLASHRPVFDHADFNELERRDPCYLLNIRGEFSSLKKELQEYIKQGEAEELHKRYKCRNRKNWYEVPIVPREVGFFFKRSHQLPKICINNADVYLTDTAYGLRIKDGYTIRGLCYSFYNSLTMLFAELDGRFYGGGVLELSPTEFRGLPLVYHEPTDKEFQEFIEAHEAARGEVNEILSYGDRWLLKKLDMSPKDVSAVQEALLLVRAHRMRHGGSI